MKKNNRKIIIEGFNHVEKKNERNPKLTLTPSHSIEVLKWILKFCLTSGKALLVGTASF